MLFNIGVIDINRWSVKVPNLWFGQDHYFKNILVFLEYHSPYLSLLFIKSASLVCVPNARIATYYLRIFDRMLKLNVSMTFYNCSIKSGHLPDILKWATIIPVHKGGSRTAPAQYRPVSLTSHIAKTLERVLRRRIVSYLESNNFFNQSHHQQQT